MNPLGNSIMQLPGKPASRTRDHLANERTYLAWMRTAISLLGFGIVIARLRHFLLPNTPGSGILALGLSLSGLATIVFSTWHYLTVLRAIERNRYEPNVRWVLLFSTFVLLIGTGVIYLLLTLPPGQPAGIIEPT